jgi:biotin carboxylase
VISEQSRHHIAGRLAHQIRYRREGPRDRGSLNADKWGFAMRPSAIVFVDRPQYGLQFLAGTIAALGYRKILVIDAEMDRRVQHTQQGLAEYDHVLRGSIHDAGGLRDVQQEIAQSYRVEAVLGFSEISVLPTAVLAEAFGVRGIGIEVARRCRNKLRMIEAFARSGVACPRYFVTERPDGLQEQIAAIGGYPVICKPLLGFASFGVIKVEAESGLEAAINRVRRAARLLLHPYYGLADVGTGQVLVESYLHGVEVAIDGYVQDGQCHFIAILDKPDVSEGPYFPDRMHIAPTRLDTAATARIRRAVEAGVAAVGLDNSPFHIEARIDEDRVYLLELAARVAFVRCIRIATGIDTLEIMIAQRLGQPPRPEPRWNRHGGVYCVTPDKGGLFESIENHQEILQTPGIVEFPIHIQPGQRIAPSPESTGDIAHIFAGADSYDEVLRILSQAKERARVIVR